MRLYLIGTMALFCCTYQAAGQSAQGHQLLNPIQVLVTSVKVSATSINPQKDCAEVIFVDVLLDAPSTQQAAGQVMCIGQQRICSVYLLTNHHSYNQLLQAAARKMLAGITAYTSHAVSEVQTFAYTQQHPKQDDMQRGDEIRNLLIDEICAQDYRIMFG